MMGNHQKIGRRMVLQSGGERLNPSAIVDEKVIKASALVTRVGRRTAFESKDESPNPSVTGKANMKRLRPKTQNSQQLTRIGREPKVENGHPPATAEGVNKRASDTKPKENRKHKSEGTRN